MISLTYRLLKKKNSQKQNELVVAKGRGWRVGEMGECGQRIQTSSYKMSKFGGCDAYNGDYS